MAKFMESAANWAQVNCPSPVVRKDLIARVAAMEQRNVNGFCAIGPALTRTGRPVLVEFYGGQFFVFELKPAQAKRLGATQANMQCTEYGQRQVIDADSATSITLDEVELTSGLSISHSKPVKGRCTYSMRGYWPEPFAIGLEYELIGRATVRAWDSHLEGLVRPDGILRFSFPPISNDSQGSPNAWTGTTVLFLRLYTMPDPIDTSIRQPLSNACGILIDVH